MADKERPVAAFAPSIRSIRLYRDGRIAYQNKSGSIIGATARVESTGSKAGFRDTRRVVLRIDGPRVAIAAALPVNALRMQNDARGFAATVNNVATELADPTPRADLSPRADAAPPADPTARAESSPSPPGSPPMADLLDHLERLGKLRDSGVLTEDEFQTQKARLLRPADA
jgi:hypothetical protein